MTWAGEQLDRLLGWYAGQNIVVQLCCFIPVILGLVGLVCLCIFALRPVAIKASSTAQVIHEESQTIITELDGKLREASERVRKAQERQEELHQHLEQATSDTKQLKKQVADMTHSELKEFMSSSKPAREPTQSIFRRYK